MSAAEVISLIKEKDVKFVDFRFTDTKGKELHVTVPAHTIDDDAFEEEEDEGEYGRPLMTDLNP